MHGCHRALSRRTCATNPMRLGAGIGRRAGRASSADAFMSPTCWPIPNYTVSRRPEDSAGFRTVLGVPLMRDGDTDRRHRADAQPTSSRSPTSRSSWSTTFADQAVIAIENVRLFDEVQARTRELYRGARAADGDRRTCSTSSAARPSTCSRCSTRWSKPPARLCEAEFAIICTLDDGQYCLAAASNYQGGSHRVRSGTSDLSHRPRLTRRPHRAWNAQTVHIPDMPGRSRVSRCSSCTHDRAASARCSACRCCAKVRRSGSSL